MHLEGLKHNLYPSFLIETFLGENLALQIGALEDSIFSLFPIVASFVS